MNLDLIHTHNISMGVGSGGAGGPCILIMLKFIFRLARTAKTLFFDVFSVTVGIFSRNFLQGVQKNFPNFLG